MTTYTARKDEGFADWHVFDDEGQSVGNFGKGYEAERQARAHAYDRNGGLLSVLRASLAGIVAMRDLVNEEIEYRDTLKAYDELARWNDAERRGDHLDNHGTGMRLRRGQRYAQTA